MTFNGKNTQPRKSSTNKRALSTRRQQQPVTASMVTGQNPSVSGTRAPPEPTPVPSYGNKWVKRTYQSTKTETATNGGVSFLNSSFDVPGPYFVDKVTVWKVGFNGLGLLARAQPQNYTDLGGSQVGATDYGTGMTLPGVTFKTPVGHAKQMSNSGTTSLVTANTAASSTTLETFVCNLTCWVSL